MVRIIENPELDLASEKSIWDVVRVSWNKIGKRVDLYISVCLVVCLFLILTTFGLTEPTSSLLDNETTKSWMMVVCPALIGASASILGFLIAGFSIFASMGRPEILRKMAMSVSPKTEPLSILKFVFYSFLVTLAYFIALIVCLTLLLLLFSDGPLNKILVVVATPIPQLFRKIALAAIISLMVGYSLYCTLLVKSFIWNLYQIILFFTFIENKPT